MPAHHLQQETRDCAAAAAKQHQIEMQVQAVMEAVRAGKGGVVRILVQDIYAKALLVSALRRAGIVVEK